MLYFANPCGPDVVEAMITVGKGRLGLIDTPGQRVQTLTGVAHDADVVWCADNGCFSSAWDEHYWWAFLVKRAKFANTCQFAVAPDVVGDAAATLAKSTPWLKPIRSLGYPVAYVAQDGQEQVPVPWDSIQCLFIGGSTGFKLGPVVRDLVVEAKDRGKWVHMGRVNSEKRYAYARAIGCDSVDGTFLVFGPKINLPKLLTWLRGADQLDLFGDTDD